MWMHSSLYSMGGWVGGWVGEGRYLGVLNGGDIVEVLGVGNAQATHTMSVPPFLEVAVEGPPAPVGVVA